MTEADRLSQSLCVCSRIVATAEWQAARGVVLYDALPDELQVAQLRAEAEAAGKKVIIPSPAADAPLPTQAQMADVDLIVVPGRAFTAGGDRVGRGGGWYDRLLARTTAVTFGVAFACQLFPTLPTEPHDVPLHRVFAG